ncbi:MAG: tetratricopeptide repeat protein [Phycisphaerae bacterium]|jgi:tetratricopeptide (TPR) repeat protein
MSDVQAQPTLRQQLAGRWQVPLLLASLAVLGAGIWRLRPPVQAPPFESLYARALALYKAELYAEAAGYLESLAADPRRTDEQRRKLYALWANVLFDHEQGNVVHGPSNPTRILELTELSLAPGEAHDAAASRMRALAYEWLKKPAQAVAEYQAAIDKGAPEAWSLRKRILDIRRATDQIEDDELLAACRWFVDSEGVSDALAYWAAEQIVELLAGRKQFAEAERFLASQAERFGKSGEKHAFDYLQALVWFHVGKKDEAERLLRAARDDLEPYDPVYARAGLLLGRMLLADEAPEYALAFFDDVLSQKPSGVPRWSAVLGRAEALDGLQRYEEALSAYNEAIQTATESPYEPLFETGAWGRSGTRADVSGMMAGQWRLPKVTAYLRTVTRRAELTLLLGRRALDDADRRGAPPEDPSRIRARARLREAGEHYVRLAGLVMLDEAGSIAATMTAVDTFDLAGERTRTAEVLEAFIRDHPRSVQVPAALLRLGETCQSMGDYERAIEAYQQNLIRYPRTPAAISSLVPLADCFLETGRPDKAEQTLLRLVEHGPDDPLGLVTPAAAQFRDALFRLADLYSRGGEYEKAIRRYTEAIERYPDDPRVERALFMLADAYRHSAGRIGQELKEGQGLAYLEPLTAAQARRLEAARDLYGQVIERIGRRDPAGLSELQRAYLKLSYLYAADSVFNLSQVGRTPATQPFADALALYERAAWACAKEPIAMSAYVQMINCYLRMGRQERARMVLQRARWMLRNMPDEAFQQAAGLEERAFWEEYLAWLETTPTLAATRPAGAS